ncbi:MAG: hypothetical protein P0116_07345 [Candidatus Nitrosocosmicus sp.]|nr:hypothetical protein [Candidatus Nitrosocosmicus sp.]
MLIGDNNIKKCHKNVKACQQLLECNDDLDKEVRKYIRYGYLNGYKRCSICEVFIKSINPSNMKCFCCSKV